MNSDIASVSQIFRYPVKSMQGEALDAAKLGWHGIRGDRRYAFLRVDDRSGLPWLSARECPELLRYSARMANADDEAAVIVTAPGNRELDVRDPALLAELSDVASARLQLVHLWRGTFDSMPLAIISAETVREIEAHSGCPLEVARFRPNLVVGNGLLKAYGEDAWVGRTICVRDGEQLARVRVCRRDPRCSIIGIDPATGKANEAIHRLVVKTRKNQLGVYGATDWPGTISRNAKISFA